jgi:predicted dehydrogenase
VHPPSTSGRSIKLGVVGAGRIAQLAHLPALTKARNVEVDLLGMLALRPGMQMLMEKPLAATLEEAQDLADLAASSRLRLQTGAMKRHDPGLAFAYRGHPVPVGGGRPGGPGGRELVQGRAGTTCSPPTEG